MMSYTVRKVVAHHRGARRAALAASAVAAAAVFAVGVTAPSASATSVLGGVDMQRACNNQYGAVYGYVAKALNRNDAFSWRCTQPWDTTRGIDVNKACATQYGPGASAGLRSRYDAYSWFCQR